MDWAGVFRNEISFFTETALYEYATPHFYTVSDFPKEFRDLRALSMYTTPWQGGWWHLKDAVDYMVGGSMSVLDLAAKNRETLLYNRYQAARDNIDHFRKEPPVRLRHPEQADRYAGGRAACATHDRQWPGRLHLQGRLQGRWRQLSRRLLGHSHGSAVLRHGQGTLGTAEVSRRDRPGNPIPSATCPTT